MEAIKEVVTQVLKTLRTPEKLHRGVLTEQWPSLVGSRIAAHTRPLLDQKGKLLVIVDQSVLAFELNQKYRQALLLRVQELLGKETVNGVFFRVGQLR